MVEIVHNDQLLDQRASPETSSDTRSIPARTKEELIKMFPPKLETFFRDEKKTDPFSVGISRNETGRIVYVDFDQKK